MKVKKLKKGSIALEIECYQELEILRNLLIRYHQDIKKKDFLNYYEEKIIKDIIACLEEYSMSNNGKVFYRIRFKQYVDSHWVNTFDCHPAEVMKAINNIYNAYGDDVSGLEVVRMPFRRKKKK
jgi:hypothetical protein